MARLICALGTRLSEETSLSDTVAEALVRLCANRECLTDHRAAAIALAGRAVAGRWWDWTRQY